MNSQSLLDSVKVDDFLEEIEGSVAKRCVGKSGDGSWSWPRDDADEQNAHDDSTLDSIKH